LSKQKENLGMRITWDAGKFRVIDNETGIILRSLDTKAEAERWVHDAELPNPGRR
jgi:hypothetical protein